MPLVLLFANCEQGDQILRLAEAVASLHPHKDISRVYLN